ncbi:MAG TPA: bifunctional nuclease family protein [Terracidiphilus sp.]|nr:bifunctional nuclease family protein [Terracidiphilus sp.]
MESDLKKRIEALRIEADEQTRKGQLDRAAQIQFGELPRLEAELKMLSGAQDESQMDKGSVEVRIRGLMMDPSTSMPIVVLKDVASEIVMPIWVGIFEANAIALEIEKVATPRPMTHDLTRNLIRNLNARLERVVISELKDDTFYAKLWLQQGSDPLVIDARPSDALALALRADCPIYVTDEVMQKAKLNTSGQAEGPTAEQLRGWLEGLNDEDLGRYKM